MQVLIFDCNETILNKNGKPYIQIMELLTDLRSRFRLALVDDKLCDIPQDILDQFECVVRGYHGGKFDMVKRVCKLMDIAMEQYILFDDCTFSVSEVLQQGGKAAPINRRIGATKYMVDRAVGNQC